MTGSKTNFKGLAKAPETSLDVLLQIAEVSSVNKLVNVLVLGVVSLIP